jgi:hypothetical protein
MRRELAGCATVQDASWSTATGRPTTWPTFMCVTRAYSEVHGQDNFDQYHGIHAEDVRALGRNLNKGAHKRA